LTSRRLQSNKYGTSLLKNTKPVIAVWYWSCQCNN